MPRVLVLMPVYAQAAFLPRAIGSLLAQDVADWELVVVDDGSPDDVAAALPDDPRILLSLLSESGVTLAHTARRPAGSEVQLVQVGHRRGDERWIERPELESDDLELLFFGRLRAAGAVAASTAVTCTWTQHPHQRHRAL